jgi:hypothetical protein
MLRIFFDILNAFQALISVQLLVIPKVAKILCRRVGLAHQK